MTKKYADTILDNAYIYSQRKFLKGPLLVSGKRISHIGAGKQSGLLRGPDTRVIDLKGGLVLPGFHDGHMHSSFGGLFRKDCDLTGLNGEKAYLEAIVQDANEFGIEYTGSLTAEEEVTDAELARALDTDDLNSIKE